MPGRPGGGDVSSISRSCHRFRRSSGQSRRVDAGFLARLVAEHRLPFDEAAETIVDLAYRLPKRVFRLEGEK